MTTNIREFSRKVAAFTGQIVPRRAQLLVRMVGLQIARGVVLKTPVDTGAARGRWQASVGNIATSATPSDPVGDSTIKRMDSVGANAPPYPVIYYANNVPYIMTLERGGYVPLDPIDSPEANARRAARRNDRQQRRARQVAGHPGAPMVRGGYSKQAPRGMVDVTLNEVFPQVERIARQIAAGGA